MEALLTSSGGSKWEVPGLIILLSFIVLTIYCKTNGPTYKAELISETRALPANPDRVVAWSTTLFIQ